MLCRALVRWRARALRRRDRALRRRDRALRSVLFVLRRRDRALRSVLFVLRGRDRALGSILFVLRRRDRALRSTPSSRRVASRALAAGCKTSRTSREATTKEVSRRMLWGIVVGFAICKCVTAKCDRAERLIPCVAGQRWDKICGYFDFDVNVCVFRQGKRHAELENTGFVDSFKSHGSRVVCP